MIVEGIAIIFSHRGNFFFTQASLTQTIYCSSIQLLSSSCQSSAKWLDLHFLPGKKIMQVDVEDSLIPVVKRFQINGSGWCDILSRYMWHQLCKLQGRVKANYNIHAKQLIVACRGRKSYCVSQKHLGAQTQTECEMCLCMIFMASRW